MNVTNTILINNAIATDENITENHNFTESFTNFEHSSVPDWLIKFYFVFISGGAILNLLHVFALGRCRKNGTLCLVMQLLLSDVLLIYGAIMEILALHNKSWIFSQNSCPIYKGTEILTNSLITYFIICLNFHIISLCNLHKWDIQKTNKNPLTACNDDSNECLVTRTDNVNRIVNIDYRKRQNDVSIILPTILIWFLCLSLSIPDYTLSSTLKLSDTNVLCAIVDHYYGQVLQYLLLMFRILIPIPLLFFTFIILLFKFLNTSPKDINNVLTKKIEEIRVLLIFCILLTVLFILTTLQRYVLYFMHNLCDPSSSNSVTSFKLPPLYNNCLNNSTSTYLAMLHYTSSSVRGFLCFYMLPKFKEIIKTKICMFSVE